jgi:hypothetical protein
MEPDPKTGKPQGHFTRLDFALDVIPHNSEFPFMDYALEHFNKDAYISPTKKIKSKKRSVKPIFSIEEKGAFLETINIGSRKSSTYARIYDKRKEQISKKNKDPGRDWHRFELECTKDRAEKISLELIRTDHTEESWSKFVKGLMLSFIHFKDIESYNKVTRGTRAKTAKWWSYLLDHAEAVKLASLVPRQRSLVEVKQDYISQLSKRIFGLGILTSSGQKEFKKTLQEMFKQGSKNYEIQDYEKVVDLLRGAGVDENLINRKQMAMEGLDLNKQKSLKAGWFGEDFEEETESQV